MLTGREFPDGKSLSRNRLMRAVRECKTTNVHEAHQMSFAFHALRVHGAHNEE